MKKSLGQNFLTDKNIVERIVHSAGVKERDYALEIGGGRGNLTGIIAKITKQLTIIETDDEYYSLLSEKFRRFETIRIFREDAKKVDYSSVLIPDKEYKVIANLPYNQAIPILINLLENHYRFQNMTLMFQREVAQRITAQASSSQYGTLSVKVYPVAIAKKAFNVSPSSFYPPPKVVSTVVNFELRDKPLVDMSYYKKFRQFITAAFSHRRKTIINSIKFQYEPIIDAIKQILTKQLGLDASIRPEQISKQQYVDLFNQLCTQNLI